METGTKLYLDCGGHTVAYSPLYPETAGFFSAYAAKEQEGTKAFAIQIDRDYMEENRWLVSEDETSEAYLEFQCLMLATGNHLLTRSRALFHGVAICWSGLAWIFTAPSGTGKTTQYRLWRKFWREEVRIINGDKPLLECRKDGSVRVHSSPWRGKERLGTRGLHARLGGIVLLEQGDRNLMLRLSPEESVLPLFAEFVSYPENGDQLRGQAAVLNQILEAVPVWKLINLGDEDSARLTRSVFTRFLEENHD